MASVSHPMTEAQVIQELTTQLAQVLDRLGTMERQLQAASRAQSTAEAQLRHVNDRLNIAEQNRAAPPSETERGQKGGLYDKRLFEPHVLEDPKGFRDWTEEFMDWIEM